MALSSWAYVCGAHPSFNICLVAPPSHPASPPPSCYLLPSTNLFTLTSSRVRAVLQLWVVLTQLEVGSRYLLSVGTYSPPSLHKASPYNLPTYHPDVHFLEQLWTEQTNFCKIMRKSLEHIHRGREHGDLPQHYIRHHHAHWCDHMTIYNHHNKND